MGIYDKDIRTALVEEFQKIPEFTDDQSTIIINELDVCSGSAIIDIAVINGKMHGFEIKSEQDTLDRLQTQAYFYNKVFDTVTLVTYYKHLDRALKIVPNWWGIINVNKGKNSSIVLEVVKKPALNPSLDNTRLAQLLWKDEQIILLKKYGITKGVKSKSRMELSKIIGNHINGIEIKNFVRETLKTRKDWKALSLQQLYDDLLQ